VSTTPNLLQGCPLSIFEMPSFAILSRRGKWPSAKLCKVHQSAIGSHEAMVSHYTNMLVFGSDFEFSRQRQLMPLQSQPQGPTNTDPRSDAFVETFSAALVNSGLLDELAMRRAKRAQAQTGERFDLVLTRLGLLTEAQLVAALSEYLSIPLQNPASYPLTPMFAEELPASFLKSSKLIPIDSSGEDVIVATADPFNGEAIDAVSFLLGRRVQRRLATRGDVDQAIDRLYGARLTPVSSAEASHASHGDDAADDDVRRLSDMASEAPIIKLVQELIVRAVEQQASDIHIEPREDSVRVRYRIDGILHTVETLPLSVRLAMSSRVKVMAELNIAERRLPQDGRIKVNVRGREIDLRVSTMPTICGESVVLRILDRSSVALDYRALGFSGQELDTFERLLRQPNGIILVTGPTGSGKTTTLYTALSTLNDAKQKLFTVEDPIEYRLAGVNQIAVNPRIGLTFASALRSMLRQDPDIIMVGEIRDLETAEIAIRASLTGHLVLSTVHTNSAAATISRLLDMGAEDYLLASSLKGVLAQRLVRRLCPKCSVSADLPQGFVGRLAELRHAGRMNAGTSTLSIKKATGCPSCRNTGFSGRTAIYELLTLSDRVRDVIVRRGTERAIEDAARQDGMITMLENGIEKVFNGETTHEEVFRVTRNGNAAL
jgi:general secretion pathway protein E